MLNLELFKPRNLLVIAVIVLLTNYASHHMFVKHFVHNINAGA